jgi:hypothetical protein
MTTEIKRRMADIMAGREPRYEGLLTPVIP